jgi:hypothetical protein
MLNRRPPLAPASPDENLPGIDLFQDTNAAGDLLLSPLRGAEEFGRSVLEIGNVIPGVEYSLGEDRIFGKAGSTVGKVATSLFEFAAAFVPVTGALGKAGKFGRTFDVTKRRAEALKRLGKPVRAVAVEGGRGALAGAAADFALFDGHEERLSNLIQTAPALRNPVTEFLAADDDDPEIVGRLKNVLEGATLGFMFDSLLGGLQAIKAGRKARLTQQALDSVDDMDPNVAEEAARMAFPGNDAENTIVRARTEGDRIAQGVGEEQGVEGGASTLGKGHKTLLELAGNKRNRQKILRDHVGMSPEEFGKALDHAAEMAEKGQTPFINPRLLDEDQLAFFGVDAGDLNTAWAANTELTGGRLARALDAAFHKLPKHVLHREKVPHAQTVQEGVEILSDSVGVNPNMMALRLASEANDTATQLKLIRQKTAAFRQGHAVLSQMFGENLSRALEEGGLSDPMVIAEVLRSGGDLAQYGQALSSVGSEAGRLLNSLKASINQDDLNAVAELLRQAGGEDNIKRTLEQLQGAWDLGGLRAAGATAKMLNQTTSQRFWAVTNEFYLNSILSGAKTFVTNVVSPMVTSFYRPLEHMAGAALLGNSREIRKAATEVVGMAQSFRESFTAASQVWKRQGAQLLDPAATVRDDAGALAAVTSDMLGVSGDTTAGAAINWFGKVVRIPSRLLSSSDEFVKQMNYRGFMYSRILDDAVARGVPTEDLTRHVMDQMEKSVIDGHAYTMKAVEDRAVQKAMQEGINDEVLLSQRVQDLINEEFDPKLSKFAEDAMTRARETTFTTELEPGSLSKWVQTGVNNHPYLRLILPFVRTPVNIAKFAGRRFPNVPGVAEFVTRKMPADAKGLQSLHTKFAREALSENPEVAAAAIGRQAMGMGGMAFFMSLAASGTITGRGPQDKEQRELLRAAGWQPYSIRVGDKWVSYLRLDPFATVIGTTADLYDYSRMAPADQQDDLQTGLMSIAFALANNFTNKTYLQGLGDFVNAMSDPERSLPHVLSKFGTNVVPNAFAQAVELSGDPYMHEAYTFMEKIRRRVPGFADDLPAMRNMFGEKITRPRGFALGLENMPGVAGDIMSMMSPIMYRDTDESALNTEFVRLQHGFAPPPTRFNGIDLTQVKGRNDQSAYDRWQELQGRTRIQGKTLKESLKELVASSPYQQLSPLSTAAEESPRIRAISTIMRRYRTQAWREVMEEMPTISRAVKQAERERRAYLSGRRSETDFGIQTLGTFHQFNQTIGNIGGQ